MGIIKRKKFTENENNMQLTTLNGAYEILGITKFPITYDEVCTHFYIKTIDTNMDEEEKQKYIQAKELILAKLSTNPFTEEPVQEKGKMTSDTDIEIGLKKENVLDKFKKKLLGIKVFFKKKRKENESFMDAQMEQEDIIILKPQKHIKEKNKKTLLHVLLVCGIVVAIYSFLIKGNEGSIGQEESIELLENYGITINGNPVTVKAEEITDYTLLSSKAIPIVNVDYLKCSYLLNKDNCLSRITSAGFYKNQISETGISEKTLIWEKSDCQIMEVTFDGIWSGNCATDIENTDEVKDAQLNLTMTENGYINGIFSFKLANLLPGEIELEGKYDFKSNYFKIYGTSWIKRPSLFVTPTFEGYYDLGTESLVSDSDSSMVFSFQKEEKNHTLLFKPLLEQQSAFYEINSTQVSIPIEEIKEYKTTLVKEEDNLTEIRYSGVLDKDILDFTVQGNAIFIKENSMWKISNHTATANYLQTDIFGQYTGTEWVEEEEYTATYTIKPSEDGSSIVADVVLEKPFKKILETRKITFENGGIKAKRIDIISDEVIGDGEAFALMDYENDRLHTDNNLTLQKENNTAKDFAVIEITDE